MTHFALMLLFAAIVAVVFGAIAREEGSGRVKYGLKVFAEFVVLGLVIAWIFYFLPV